MKKIDDKLRQFVNKCVQNHRYNIQHEHYRIEVEYAKEDNRDDKTGHHVFAEMVVNRRYLSATLRLFPKAYANRDWALIEDTIAHEVSHLATQHMLDLAISCYKDEGETLDAWESLTELIARLSKKIQASAK